MDRAPPAQLLLPPTAVAQAADAVFRVPPNTDENAPEDLLLPVIGTIELAPEPVTYILYFKSGVEVIPFSPDPSPINEPDIVEPVIAPAADIPPAAFQRPFRRRVFLRRPDEPPRAICEVPGLRLGPPLS